ncbi:tape measure protein [Rufibacter ruber]|uniref:tape measure protein n=1 Tax=Rufibacter ruber TaxID=1783499 RepID=UPI00082B11CE|nr:tape measure protein [Rufibacter ruber]
MANIVQYIIELKDKFSSQISQAAAKVNEFEGKVDRANQKVSGFGSTIKGMAVTAAAAFAAMGVMEFGQQVVKAGTDMEQTRIAFKTFLGDAEKGNAMIATLQKFSIATPFDDAQVIKAGRSLLAFGVDAADVESKLKMLGNISSAVGKDFNELATIYGKNKISGVIQAEDLNQLTEAGIPAIAEIAKVMKVSEKSVKKLGSEGKITFAVLEKALQNLGGTTGKWGKMMDEQSNTVAGRWSALQGMYQNTMTKIGESMLPLMNRIIDFINSTVQAFKDVYAWCDKYSTVLESLAVGLTAAAAAWGVYAVATNFWTITAWIATTATTAWATALSVAATAMTILMSPVFLVIAAIAALAAGVYYCWNKFEVFRGSLYGIWNVFKALLPVAGALGKVLVGIATFNPAMISGGIASAVAEYNKMDLSKAFSSGMKQAKDEFAAEAKAEEGKKATTTATTPTKKKTGDKKDDKKDDKKLSSKISGVSSNRPTSIHLTINKLVETLEVNTTNMKEGSQQIRKMIAQQLAAAVGDVEAGHTGN